MLCIGNTVYIAYNTLVYGYVDLWLAVLHMKLGLHVACGRVALYEPVIYAWACWVVNFQRSASTAKYFHHCATMTFVSR
jgi:hypothetical protein